jgi:hypothetical protein
MKHTIIKSIFMLLFALTTSQLKAQSNIITDTISVQGNCGECKERIEDAAFIKGVKSASWNKEKDLLAVIYNAEKTSLEKISLAVANIGHDTRLHTGNEKKYKKLPSCCAYRTNACLHD